MKNSFRRLLSFFLVFGIMIAAATIWKSENLFGVKAEETTVEESTEKTEETTTAVEKTTKEETTTQETTTQETTTKAPETTTEIVTACPHTQTTHFVKASTCLVKGSEFDQCRKCNEILNFKELELSNKHKKGEYYVTKEPTCIAKGEKIACCTVGGREVDKIGLDMVDRS